MTHAETAYSSQKQPRRFRISVSPTRKLDSEPDPEPMKKYLIKQTVIAGSVSTFGGSSSSGLEKNKPIGRAPRIEFGEDDSPRVVEIPPKRN